MEFRETLLAAQRNQQQKSSGNLYYKARFDPPKKEQKQRDRLSANIQKFLAKKDEEERQKKLDAERKRQELLAMRDPKALRKIQKTLKVIKSANKSVIEDAVDRDNTAITRDGPDQPDQDDYGYESQEAAALYQKMMQKYSKIPEEPKFPVSNSTVKKDLNGTRERVKHALQHEDEPVPHKRRRKGDGERDTSPSSKYEPEKKKEDQKPEKPKIRKVAPPPMDFNQLLKLAEQKKCVPVDVAGKKQTTEQEADRLMTKKQKKEYEEELARRQRRQERLEAEKAASRKGPREEKPPERKPEPSFGRIPKLGDKSKKDSLKVDRERQEERERDRVEKLQREKDRIKVEKEKIERERLDRERLDKLKAERDRIDREMDRLNRDRDRLDKTRLKLENNKTIEKTSKPVEKAIDRSKLFSKEHGGREDAKKNIDLKSQNTYRIDKNTNDKKSIIPNKSNNGKYLNGHSSQSKPMTKLNREQIQVRNDARDKAMVAKQKTLYSDGSLKLNGKVDNGKRLPESSKGMPLKRPDDRNIQNSNKSQAGSSKPKLTSTFDFDKHVNSLKKNGNIDGGRQFPPGDVRRKMDDIRRKQKLRTVQSDSEYDSEMDDFIDDGEENMDYSRHIKEIFGYDKSKYRDMDDDDDPMMESSFARQQREEYISKKIGIMEDLEDMKLEAMEKKKKKKTRRISDD
ncbi:protein SPT2 homolog [Achroia grisella]|uniref:protein SPT2 homolog n=1 Tax=Achroia grisella TaxID=688607 RepID=UPI0027D2ABDF|nr:protein SPT2 homolog [Achroia grisella]